MSIDKLQNLIRKQKNPLMVSFCADMSLIAPQYSVADNTPLLNFSNYVKDLLPALQSVVPAVRFDFGSFGICGSDGIAVLAELLSFAKELGFYVLLDAPEIFSPQQASLAVEGLMGEGSIWEFDGLLLSSYMGSDVLKSFADRLKDNDKDLFVILRSANKSASEIQDLLTGSRLVYTAAADITKRLGEPLLGRCGYSRIAGVGPATSPDALLTLRNKYPNIFLLVDGCDYSGANAKNCALAFDKLGHGAIACAGDSVVAAWREADTYQIDAIALAIQAAERLKKNLNRYVTIL